jgi:hypothetical protein
VEATFPQVEVLSLLALLLVKLSLLALLLVKRKRDRSGGHVSASRGAQFTFFTTSEAQFTCFTTSAQFTCFTSTKVQMLTATLLGPPNRHTAAP